MSFFEPSPVLLAFLFVKQFLYLELVAVLALLRVVLGGGLSRLMALAALALALAGIATVFAPALGYNMHPLYLRGARMMAMGQGLWALLAPSILLAFSAFLPGRRWRWIDYIHIVLLWGLVGLWVATRYV